MSANDTQIGGKHYKADGIEPWDYVAANNLGFFEGNIVKYVSRWKDKGGVDDLRKAKHYIEKLIELETQVKPEYEGERVILPKFDESKTIHGFIPWTGGSCPVGPEEIVEVLFADQLKRKGMSSLFWWVHGNNRGNNIVGYRVIK
jgi:hypothetical protein